MAMGIKVISTDGSPVAWGKALLRYIGYIVSGIPLSLGFIWAAFDAKRQGRHDKIASTYVVRKDTHFSATDDVTFVPSDAGSSAALVILLVMIPLVLVLVAIVVIAILLLLGPVVGNVFSNIVLKQAAKVVQQARRKRAIEPRFMGFEEMRRATDVLPISFLDMQENYAVLHGRDTLADLAISRENLRLQCESQLRVILLRMRHRFLYSIRDRQRLRTILSESFTKFLHILKTLYRLEGETPPTGKADIVAGAAERYGLDRDVLTGLLELKLGTRKFGQEELEELFEGYLSVVKAVTTQVDRMAVG